MGFLFIIVLAGFAVYVVTRIKRRGAELDEPVNQPDEDGYDT